MNDKIVTFIVMLLRVLQSSRFRSAIDKDGLHRTSKTALSATAVLRPTCLIVLENVKFSNAIIFTLALSFCLFGMQNSCGWEQIQINDSLRLFAGNTPTGLLIHRCNFNDSTNSIESVTELLVKPANDRSSTPSMEILEKRSYDCRENLVSAFQELKSPAGNNTWRLEKDQLGVWHLTVVAGGQATTRKVESINENINSDRLLYLGILKNTLSRNDTWIDTTFELISGTSNITTTKCIRMPSDSGAVWVFESTDSFSGRKDTRSITSGGKTVYQEVAPLFVARALSDSTTHSNQDISGNLFEMFGIENVDGAASDELILLKMEKGLEPDSTVLGFYNVTSEGYILKSLEVKSTKKKNVVVADSLRRYLKPTVTVQSNDQRIRSIAQLLEKRMGKKATVSAKIERFNRFVDSSIVNKNSATFSSALETLAAGFGDCGEHAVLLAALLRSIEIPARVIVGLVYLESKRGYYYHAWVLAHDGNNWIFTDPALGVSPSPLNRVPLLIDDDGSKMVYLSKYIGRITIQYTKR